MSKLTEIRITESNLRLDNNIVKGGILPNKINELSRTVTVAGETVVEGPLYANKMTIEAAPFEVKGAVFVQRELYINNDVSGDIIFRKVMIINQRIIPHQEINSWNNALRRWHDASHEQVILKTTSS